MAALRLIQFYNWKTQDLCAKKYFNIHFSKITFARGKCPDIKSRNETGFLTRLSNCLSIDSWGTTSDPEDAQTHPGGSGLCLPPPLSLLTETPLCFPDEHYSSLPCLIDVFLATSDVPSLSITRVHPSGLGQCRKVHPPSGPRPCLL